MEGRPVAIDADDARQALLGLVVALVEVIHEVLRRQAARRLAYGTLSPEESDRVGRALMELERVLTEFKQEQQLETTVADMHRGLNRVVTDLVGVSANAGDEG